MAFSPQNFYSNLKRHDGPAKTSRFQTIMPIPPYISSFMDMSVLQQLLDAPANIIQGVQNIFTGKNFMDAFKPDSAITRYLAMQCESAEIPGTSLITADVKIYGPTFKIPYQKQFSDMNMTFICTNDFYEKKLFDTWIEAIMPLDTNNLRFPKGESTGYMTDITIMQYDEFIKQIYAVKLIDAFPISVAAMPLSWAEESFHRVTVSFSYRKFETIYEGKYNIAEALGDGANALFSDFTRQFAQNIF